MTYCIPHTHDLERIRALPRRRLSRAVAAGHAARITEECREPGAPDGTSLRPWQGQALHEIVTCGGAWLALPVGLGKTLISYLAPRLLGAKRTLYVLPANLREKTWADFAAYRGAWRRNPSPIRIESREALALAKNQDLLASYGADLIVIDEADELANAKSSAARRLGRYITARRDAGLPMTVVAMTGTPGRLSILDYWHLLVWCLGARAPMPLRRAEVEAWANALDERQRGPRARPGPLGATRDKAIEWYGARLRETPGVVIVDEDSAGDTPLVIRQRLARECRATNERFDRFAVEQENPGGIPVSDGLARWLLDGQLGLGYYTRWNPPPPEEWRNARRTFAKFVRETIARTSHAANPCDTELQVARRYESHPIVAEWLRVKPTFDAQTEAVWFSRAALDSCLDWLDESDEPGIVWTGSVDFARALARDARLPYYAQNGCCEGGGSLVAAKRQDMVVSWKANKKGFNLQPWARHLVTMPPQSAKWLEQLMGRSHRSGQTRAVTVDLLISSGGTQDAFERALDEARFNQGTLTLTQKVLRADIRRATPRINASNEHRWARAQKDQRDNT